MNNNNNNNKHDSDGITTKKGFLISLPGKKKSNEASSASSINMAKTVNSESSINMSTPSTDKNVQNKRGFDHSRKNNNGAKNTFSENNEQTNNAGSNRDGKNNKNNRRDKKHRNKQKNFRDNRNENRVDAENQHNADNSRKNTNDKTKKQNNNNERSFDNKNENRNNRRNRNDRRNAQKSHFDSRDELRQEKQPEVKINVENNKKNPSVSPLSSLSSDFSSFGKSPSRHSFADISDVKPESELSLEEKYQNAVPLAQQIAEENAKARHPMTIDENTEKQEIIGVRFREAGKIYYFDPDGTQVPFACPVIVETARGAEYGFTAISNRFIPSASLVSPLKKIVRIATEDDTRKYVANKALEKDSAKIFREKVEKLGLEMNLIYVEYTFDNSKLLFYFTAESRVDFRELVKELAGVFRTRIELRQIGVRDEAKVLGGMGVCGRATCCSTFLGDFAQVSIKMAKDQSLSLNAAKISGACGKLMCCLRYEDKVYEQENARTPKVGALVETPEGKGTVTERNTLKGTIKVALDTEEATPPKLFSRDEVKIISHGNVENDSEHDDNADEIKDEE